MAKFQSTDKTKCSTKEDVEQQVLSYILGGNVKWYSHFGRQLAVSCKIINILLTYDPVIVLLGIYPKELKTYVHTKSCRQMFTAALFIIAKTWKQPRFPSIGE